MGKSGSEGGCRKPTLYYKEQGAFSLPYDMLQSYIGTTILNNSEFIALLKQSNLDSQELERVAGIPAAQLKYVSNSPAGTGIIKHGAVIVPFDSRMEKENHLYRLFNTNIHEKFQMAE